MKSIKPFRSLACVVSLVLFVATARADDMGHSAARDRDAPSELNLSRDLVRLGIAAQNLPPDDPSFDARPIFQAAVAYAGTHPIRRLTVDRGAYYFLTPQDSQSYLRFPSFSDLVIDLAGSKIFFAGAFLQGFAIVNSQRVTLENFTVDFLQLPYTEVQLIAVDSSKRTLAYTTLPSWVDPEVFTGASQPPVPVTLWAVVFRNGDIVPGTSRMQVAQPISVGTLALVQDNTPWTQSATLATLRPGDTIVVTERGGSPPVIAFNSDEVTIAHATIFGASAIAVLLNKTSHSTVDHVQVMPRPGSLIASNADGIHFVDAGSDDHIRSSFVTRTLDDALAIDALDPATVTSQAGPRQVAVTRTAFTRFPDGTRVSFVDAVSDQELAGGTILSQFPPDSNSPVFDGSVTLTFDRDLPTLAPGFGMAFANPDERGTGSSIEDSVVAEVPFGRGIWIAGSDDVTVARNRIGHTSNGGIVVAQDTTFYPVPPASDIIIEHNTLQGSLGPMASGTGTQIAVGAVIVESTNHVSAFSPLSVNKNITIARNKIIESGRSGIWVGELDGGDIRDNVIARWDQHPELPLFGVNAQTRAQLLQDFTQPLVVHDSQNITAQDNDIDADSEPDDGAADLDGTDPP